MNNFRNEASRKKYRLLKFFIQIIKFLPNGMYIKIKS